jgi:hypothetical protein
MSSPLDHDSFEPDLPDQNQRLQALLDRVIVLAQTGQREELLSLLSPIFFELNATKSLSIPCDRPVAILALPLAALWKGKHPIFEFRKFLSDDKKRKKNLQKFERLLTGLNFEMKNGTPFPDQQGMPKPLDKMKIEEALGVLKTIVDLQLDGLIRFMKAIED